MASALWFGWPNIRWSGIGGAYRRGITRVFGQEEAL
jgi:hypothetical protein